MPRDLRNLESEKSTLEAMPQLSKEPAASPDHDNYSARPIAAASPGAEHSSSPPLNDPTPFYRMPTLRLDDRFKKLKDLHPYSLLLSQRDLDQCDWLEHAAFDPIEAASREKIDYRLTTCGALCSGIFTSAYPTHSGPQGILLRTRTTPSFPSADSADSDRKKVLLGHIIATQHREPLVTDAAMSVPPNWRTTYEMSPASGQGHDELGTTVCLHSLCVHPAFQGRGLGRVLLVGWTQRLRDAGLAKRVALICRDRYVGWYEKAGFKLVGESKCQYGGGGWMDMVLEFGDKGQEEF